MIPIQHSCLTLMYYSPHINSYWETDGSHKTQSYERDVREKSLLRTLYASPMPIKKPSSWHTDTNLVWSSFLEKSSYADTMTQSLTSFHCPDGQIKTRKTETCSTFPCAALNRCDLWTKTTDTFYFVCIKRVNCKYTDTKCQLSGA